LDSNEFLTSISIILSGYQPFSVADYYITACIFLGFLKSCQVALVISFVAFLPS